MRRTDRPKTPQTSPQHPAVDYRPPGYFTALRWTAIAVALLAITGALYVGLWFFTAAQLRDGVLAWVDARRAEGLTVAYDRFDIGGFPFALRIRMDGPSIAAPQVANPWKWETQAITARMRPWSLNRVTVRAPGDHVIVRTIDGQPRTFRGKAQTALGKLQIDGGRITAADLTIRNFSLEGPGEGRHWAVGRASITAAVPSAGKAAPDTPAADLRLRLANVRVPDRIGMPLGSGIEALEINAGLMGAVPILPLADIPLADALALWRDDGGTVEVRRLNLTYGPLVLNADGTLALDGSLQPVGAFTARAEGFFETVDALRKRGIIRSSDATAAKIVLGVMARRTKSGHAALTLPISVQDRRLFAGPVPLIEIPEIIWGPPPRIGD